MAKELLAAAAGAGQSDSVRVPDREKATLIMYAALGLTAAEYGDIQISHDGGTTFQDLFVDGSQIRLSNVNIAATVYGPGIFRVDKEATTNATGIYVAVHSDL